MRDEYRQSEEEGNANVRIIKQKRKERRSASNYSV